MKSRDDQLNTNIVMLGQAPDFILTESQPPLFRGDKSKFIEVFEQGFHARGTNTNYTSHILGLGNSAFIPTSTSRTVAANFPIERPAFGSYVYEIHSTRPRVNAEEKLPSMLHQRKISEYEYRTFIRETEKSFRTIIYPHEIRGAWYVNPRGEIVENFIPNPSYRAPVYPAQQLWKASRSLGQAFTTLGVAVDGMNIWHAYQHSPEAGNREVIRTVGGWTGALAGGAAGAELALTVCPWANLVPVAGPILSSGCAVSLTLGGSWLGYQGGSIASPHLVQAVKNCVPPAKALSLSQSEGRADWMQRLTRVDKKELSHLVPYFVTADESLKDATKKHFDRVLNKIFKHDVELKEEVKHHALNIKQIKQNTEQFEQSFEKFCKEQSTQNKQVMLDNLSCLNSGLQFCGLLGALTDNTDLQRRSMIGANIVQSVTQIATAVPQIMTAIGSATTIGAAVSAAFPPAMVVLGALGVLASTLKKKKKKKAGPDPHLEAMSRMTKILVREIHNMWNAMNHGFSHLSQQVHEGFSEASRERAIYYQALQSSFEIVFSLSKEIKHHIEMMQEEAKDARSENQAQHYEMMERIAHCESLILAAMEENSLLGLSKALLRVKRLTNLENIETTKKRESTKQEVLKADRALLDYIVAGGLSTQGSLTGANLAKVPLHLSATEDNILSNVSSASGDALAKRMGYLLSVAKQLRVYAMPINLSQLISPKGNHLVAEYLQSRPFDLLNINATVNPFLWNNVVSHYVRLRTIFGAMIDHPLLTEINSIIPVGEAQLKFIDLIQTTPELFERIFDELYQALQTIEMISLNALISRNYEFNEEIAKRFPDKKIDHPISFLHKIEEHKDMKFARSLIEGGDYTIPCTTSRVITDNARLTELTNIYNANRFTHIANGRVTEYVCGVPNLSLDHFIATLGGSKKTISESSTSNKNIGNIEFEKFVTKADNFPEELKLLEYLGKGHFKLSRSGTWNDASGKKQNWSVKVEFNFDEKLTPNSKYVDLGQFNVKLDNDVPSVLPFIPKNEKLLQTYKTQARNQINEQFTEERKKVIARVISQQHTNGLHMELRKLDAYRNLLLAFMHVAGHPHADLVSVEKHLASSKVILSRLKTYAESKTTTVNTNPPIYGLVPAFEKFGIEFLAKKFTPAETPFTAHIRSGLGMLSFAKSHEENRQRMEIFDLKEEIQSMVKDYDALYGQDWKENWIPKFEKMSSEKKTYQECKQYLKTADAVYRKLHTPMPLAEKIGELKKMNKLCEDIHAKFISLDIGERGYNLPSSAVRFLDSHRCALEKLDNTLSRIPSLSNSRLTENLSKRPMEKGVDYSKKYG